jgi:hypothetical protein
MNNADKRHLIKWNTLLWITAMVLPAVVSIAFAGTKFPWHITVPLLLVGPMLASNKMLIQAMANAAGA